MCWESIFKHIINFRKNSTGNLITEVICAIFYLLQVLDDLKVDKSRIIGLVYDTTSVNSGVRGGIVKLLEDAFGRKLLQLPCRHHVYELVCAAAAAKVYGGTTAPYEDAFKTFAKAWKTIDHSKLEPLKVSPHK